MKKNTASAAISFGFALAAIMVGHEASASQAIHPDCIDSPNPNICTRDVEELQIEVGEMVEAYAVGDIADIMSFHSSPGLVYKIFDDFHRGAASYENEVICPLFENVADSLVLDLSNLRYQMITKDVYIQYGNFTDTITFKGGFSVTTPRRVMITWVKNTGADSHDRPFVIAANMQEIIASYGP